MIIGNFSPLNLRVDKGALWENFLVAERLKQHAYKETFAKMYFWRTRDQQKIDLIEDRDGQIFGFEFKWDKNKAKIPRRFVTTYDAKTAVINRNNFRDFVKGGSIE